LDAATRSLALPEVDPIGNPVTAQATPFRILQKLIGKLMVAKLIKTNPAFLET
jgi:hypothetical protein